MPGSVRWSALVVVVTAILVTSACSVTDNQAAQDPDSLAVTGPDPNLAELPLSADEVIVVVANSPGTVSTGGEQRVMTALVDPSGIGYLGSDLDPIEAVFTPLGADGDGQTDRQRLTATWLSAAEADLGLYVSHPTFDAPGAWEVRIESLGHDIGGTVIEVSDDSVVPHVGGDAPPTRSPTAGDNGVFDLSVISTDPQPDPDFYQLSIDEAIANGRPTVIVFATPAFCQTALCGPTMVTVKAVIGDRDDLDVVHVEPFDLDRARNGVFDPVQAMDDWNLPTEPWVFVVDDEGTVRAAFEGIFGEHELRQALDRL